MESIRLNKFIAQNGTVSRRKADQLIRNGQVQINGNVIRELGTKININDQVRVDGKLLTNSSQKIYIIFNKPKSVLSTMHDPEERETVAKYFEHLPVRVFPVGRLDWDSEGLLLMTNDGDFANKVMHPKFEINKTYLVKVEGRQEDEKIKKLSSGISIIGGKVKAKLVQKINRSQTSHSWYKIVISEGRNRQIRQMFEKIGADVLKIQRIGIGALFLGHLDKGEYKFLNDKDLKLIFKTQLDKPTPKKRHRSTKRIL